jgi:Arc/MetJ-type ribon-helix-helix transcriptional regulator
MAQKRTHVFLPDTLLAAIDEFVGKGKRSSFIADIIEREMRRQKLLKAVGDARGCWKSEDHPELKKGAVAWVNELREGWDARLPKDS